MAHPPTTTPLSFPLLGEAAPNMNNTLKSHSDHPSRRMMALAVVRGEASRKTPAYPVKKHNKMNSEGSDSTTEEISYGSSSAPRHDNRSNQDDLDAYASFDEISMDANSYYSEDDEEEVVFSDSDQSDNEDDGEYSRDEESTVFTDYFSPGKSIAAISTATDIAAGEIALWLSKLSLGKAKPQTHEKPVSTPRNSTRTQPSPVNKRTMLSTIQDTVDEDGDYVDDESIASCESSLASSDVRIEVGFWMQKLGVPNAKTPADYAKAAPDDDSDVSDSESEVSREEYIDNYSTPAHPLNASQSSGNWASRNWSEEKSPAFQGISPIVPKMATKNGKLLPISPSTAPESTSDSYVSDAESSARKTPSDQNQAQSRRREEEKQQLSPFRNPLEMARALFGMRQQEQQPEPSSKETTPFQSESEQTLDSDEYSESDSSESSEFSEESDSNWEELPSDAEQVDQHSQLMNQQEQQYRLQMMQQQQVEDQRQRQLMEQRRQQQLMEEQRQQQMLQQQRQQQLMEEQRRQQQLMEEQRQQQMLQQQQRQKQLMEQQRQQQMMQQLHQQHMMQQAKKSPPSSVPSSPRSQEKSRARVPRAERHGIPPQTVQIQPEGLQKPPRPPGPRKASREEQPRHTSSPSAVASGQMAMQAKIAQYQQSLGPGQPEQQEGPFEAPMKYGKKQPKRNKSPKRRMPTPLSPAGRKQTLPFNIDDVDAYLSSSSSGSETGESYSTDDDSSLSGSESGSDFSEYEEADLDGEDMRMPPPSDQDADDMRMPLPSEMEEDAAVPPSSEDEGMPIPDDVEESEVAVPDMSRHYEFIEDPDLKRLCTKLHKKVNLDPWDDTTELKDEYIRDFIQDHPETCEVQYFYKHFNERLFPLSMLCAVGASAATIKAAYEACKGAVDQCDLWIGSPLHYACAYRASIDVVRFLTEIRPGMLKKTNDMGRTPMHVACVFKGSMATISHLIKALPHVLNAKDANGCTPLHLAAQNGASTGVVSALIRANRSTCMSRTKFNMTPLHLASKGAALRSVVKTLIDADPRAVTAGDDLGRTPLHIAAEFGAPLSTVQMLLKANPDMLEEETHRGETPLKLAEKNNAPSDVIKFLS